MPSFVNIHIKELLLSIHAIELNPISDIFIVVVAYPNRKDEESNSNNSNNNSNIEDKQNVFTQIIVYLKETKRIFTRVTRKGHVSMVAYVLSFFLSFLRDV